MDNKNAQFAGSIPAAYDRYLGPILFQSYAEELAARLAVDSNSSVLELACGTGILTRKLRDRLPESVKLVATDLNEPMFRHAARKFRKARPSNGNRPTRALFLSKIDRSTRWSASSDSCSSRTKS
jgi:ubiquinone/menaquinone biosynthesis C-methylase UbiE